MNKSVQSWRAVAGKACGVTAVILGLALPAENAVAAPGSSKPATKPAAKAKVLDLDALFAPGLSDAQFARELQKAKTAGASQQMQFEARLLHSMEGGDWSTLAGLLPEAERVLPSLEGKTSRLFSAPGQARGMLYGLRALRAHQQGDDAGFEKWIKEAFWTAPSMSELFVGWTQQFQQEQRMAKLVLPLDLQLATAEGKSTTLKQLLGGNKALLLDFWASWCGPCMELIPELKAKGKKLAPQGVIVAGINTENSAAKARQVKQGQKIALPWLIEPKGEPYSTPLGIDSIPRMILVTADGKIHFNGHPMDPQLAKALAKFGVKL